VQARLVAEHLSKALGQPVVVDNKPGASGNIGADLIAKADDGYTIGIIGNGPLTSSKFLYTKLPYDPAKDFAPIVMVGTAPLVWVAPKSAVTGSVADYLKSVKDRRRKGQLRLDRRRLRQPSGDGTDQGEAGAAGSAHSVCRLGRQSSTASSAARSRSRCCPDRPLRRW
jgi:hypothetical protein